MNVRVLVAHAATTVVLLEELGTGHLGGWIAPRWVSDSSSLIPLMRCKLNTSNPIVDALGTDTHRFPEFRLLEMTQTSDTKIAVFYAPFPLKTLALREHGWNYRELSNSDQEDKEVTRWEQLADLSRNIEVYTDEHNVYQVRLGDLRAIDERAFRFLPHPTRALLEAALSSLP